MNRDFEDQFDEEEEGSRLNFITLIVITLAICGIGILSWYGYNSYRDSKSQSQDVPIISSDAGDRKVSPIDPGGMKFSDMNRKVLNSLGENNVQAERILAAPEEPINKEEIIKKELTANPTINSHNSIAPITNDGNKDEQNSVKEVEASDVISEIPQSNELDNSVTKTEDDAASEKGNIVENSNVQKSKDLVSANKVNVKENKAKKSVIKPMPKGKKFSDSDYSQAALEKTYRVQIASFKSEKEANKSLKIQSRQAEGLLNNLPHMIEQKNLPVKGLVYRLQVGSFKNESGAAELCKQLKMKQIDCFVVRP